jgi:hypothetical integral membrane protein (TIGR02206 family)
LFGQQHLLLLLLMLIGGMLWMAVAQRGKERGKLRTFEVLAALLIGGQYAAERAAYLLLRPDYALVELLPFQLCGLSTLLSVWLLMKPSELGFNVLYIWGFGGAAMGLLMPEVEYGFPHPLNLTFFLGHAYPIYVAMHFVVVRRFRPRILLLPQVFVITMILLGIMMVVNPVLGTNYLFVSGKPMGGELLNFMGPWPIYIVWMVAFGTSVALLLHAPFLVARRPEERLEVESGNG